MTACLPNAMCSGTSTPGRLSHVPPIKISAIKMSTMNSEQGIPLHICFYISLNGAKKIFIFPGGILCNAGTITVTLNDTPMLYIQN